MKSLDKKIIQKETFNDNITEKIVVKETKRKKTPSGEAVGRPEYKEDEKVLVVAKNVFLEKLARSPLHGKCACG